MKHQASFSSKNKSKIIKVSSAAILLGALRVKQFFSQKQRMITKLALGIIDQIL